MNTSTLLKKANRLLVKKANELLAPHGITHAYTPFLLELYQENGLTQAKIHKRIGIKQPTAVRILDRMERDGLILRTASATDRRAVLITLTEQGKKCEKIISTCTKELNQCALKNITATERALLNRLLSQLNTNLMD
jgi:MarR family transcriptional regulator for hemolysin